MAYTNTYKAIDSSKAKQKEYKLTVDRGLYIRVAPNGVKKWFIRYVVNGKQDQITLPKPFGDSAGYMSITEAKEVNAIIQSKAKAGINYKVEQGEIEQLKQDVAIQKVNEEKSEIAKNITFRELFDSWVLDGVNRTDGNKSIKMHFKNHAFPTLAEISLRKLSEKDLLKTYRLLINKSKNRTAVMLSKDIKQMLKWAEKRPPWRQLLQDGNPAELIDMEILLPKDYQEERTRILSNDEIRKLRSIFSDSEETYKHSINKYEVSRPVIKETQIALWLCLSTICRIGELLLTEWKHVDFKERTWFIPKENVKGTRRNKQAQIVYLSDLALENFKQLFEITGHSKWAFPASKNIKNSTDNHICLKSVSKQVGDRQIQLKNRTKLLNKRINDNSLVIGEEDWTPHDLRRTGATMMQELGITLDVIDRCQNHVLAGARVRRHYLHHEYADEKKEAWNKLGERINLIFNTDNSNIKIGRFNKAA